MPSFPDRPAAFPGWVGLATQPKIPDADRSDPLAEVPPVRMPMALVRPEALAGWRAGE